MNKLTKAQIIISILACFSLGWGLIKNALSNPDYSLVEMVGYVGLQLVTIVVLSFVLIGILKWVNVFDLKTNALLSLVTVVTLGLALIL